MKVLFQSRVNLFKNLGGDSIQILKTKEYLEKIGAMVDISTELNPNLSSYDLVHLFNLNRPQEVYEQARNSRKQNKKVVLSTIYGKYTEYDKKGRFGVYKFTSKFLNNSQLEYLKIAARAIRNKEFHRGTVNLLFNGYKKLQRKLIDIVDFYLPNSEMEIKEVMQDFGVKLKIIW